MTRDPASIEPIAAAARRALRAWKRSRAVRGLGWGLAAGLLALAVHGLVIELRTVDGLRVEHLPPLLAWLLLGPVAALGAWLAPLPTARAARELDRRAGLDDRISTALEFADDPSPIARLQRIDAASVADVAVAPLFPVPWRRLGPPLLVALLLALVTVGVSLTFDLGRRPPPVADGPSTPAEDLLAAIESERDLLLEAGDKEGVRLLDDMAREVRRIEARREELKRRVAERKRVTPPDPDAPEPELLPPPPTPKAGEQKKRTDLITAEDLDALEAQLAEQIQLTDTQMGDLTSQLFSSTRAAKKLNEEFHHHVEHEMDATIKSQNASQYGAGNTNMGKMNEKMSGMDMLGAQGATSDRLSDTGDIESQGQDMVTRDLSAESQAAHDGAHDQQHSFNEFLKDFVKDMQGTAAEAAMGKKPKKGREVQTNTGQGMADKRDAMAESGFQEMDGSKRASGEAPPEEMMGGEPGEAGDGGAGGEGSGNGEPGDGPPPENLDNLQQGSGEPGENAVAIKAGESGGQTSAGASGAGSGDPGAAGARAGHIEGLAKMGGPLDKVLGAMGEGAIPQEEREQIFDRIARHKVQGGLASEADDVLLDYFAQAEELIEGEEALSPLFRDFATLYFDSIRPGSGPSAPDDPAEADERDRSPAP